MKTCLYNLLNDTFSAGVEWECEHERQIGKDVECSGRGRLKHYIYKKNYISSSPVAMRKNQHSLSLGLDCGSTVVKELCYKSEGRWFDPS